MRHLCGIILFTLTLLSPAPFHAKAVASGAAEVQYVIELSASLKPLKLESTSRNNLQNDHLLYQDSIEQGSKTWYRQRVGFFKTYQRAQEAARAHYSAAHPQFWVASVSASQVHQLRRKHQERFSAQKPMVSADNPEQLVRQGESAMAKKDYPRAIQTYQQLVKSGKRDVQELAAFQLALSYELDGQLSNAKSAYEAFVQDHPDSSNVDQARERLDKLLRVGGPGSFIAPATLAMQQIEIHAAADSHPVHPEDSRVQVVSTTTSIDSTWHLPNKSGQIKSVILGNFATGYANEWDEETRLSQLYYDTGRSSRLQLASRWGRQAAAGGGLSGTFDGARFSYLLTPSVQLNLATGFPVNTAFERADVETYFYSLSTDIGRIATHWELQAFVINQGREGLLERQAIGGDLHYLADRTRLNSSVDYDLLFEQFNRLSFGGETVLPNGKSRMVLNVEQRQNQTLRLSNALAGQTERSLVNLQRDLGTDSIKQLARDRTRNTRFIKVSLRHPATRNVEMVGDISWSLLDGAPASGGVDAIASDGAAWNYAGQMIGSNLLRPGDMTVLAVRYSTTSPRDSYALSLDTRYPLQDNWRINPKVQFDYLSNNTDAGDEWRVQPSLGFQCSLRHQWRLNVESGINLGDTSLNGAPEDIWRYFVSLGVRREL